MNNIFDARQYIINELGDRVNDLRVKAELSLMTEKNFMEIYYAKKVADYLRDNNEYYLVRGIYSNLYINYLLKITEVESSKLPYEFLFIKNDTSFVYEFNVSKQFEPKIVEYLNDVSCGIMVRTKTSCLIPYMNQHIKLGEYENRCHDKLIEIGILSLNGLDKLNENIKQYGLPGYDIRDDEQINSAIFDDQNIDCITGTDADDLKCLLIRCDKSLKNFSTYVYLLCGLHGTNVIKQFKEDPIDLELIQKYPTSREKLYEFLLSRGISKQKALLICEYTRMGRNFRERNIIEWDNLTDDITVSLKRYLDNIEGFFPIAHCMTFAKLNYLEIYYKLIMEGKKKIIKVDSSNGIKSNKDSITLYNDADYKVVKKSKLQQRTQIVLSNIKKIYLVEYQEIWNKIRKLIKREISIYTYEECFMKASRVVEFENGLIYIEVPSSLIRFKINQCYYKLIDRIKSYVTQEQIKFEFVVNNKLI